MERRCQYKFRFLCHVLGLSSVLISFDASAERNPGPKAVVLFNYESKSEKSACLSLKQLKRFRATITSHQIFPHDSGCQKIIPDGLTSKIPISALWPDESLHKFKLIGEDNFSLLWMLLYIITVFKLVPLKYGN